MTDSHAFNGAYSALVRGDYQLAQSFDPSPGANIEVFSVTVMTAIPARVTVEIEYDDAMDPTRVSLFVPGA